MRSARRRTTSAVHGVVGESGPEFPGELTISLGGADSRSRGLGRPRFCVSSGRVGCARRNLSAPCVWVGDGGPILGEQGGPAWRNGQYDFFSDIRIDLNA